MTTIKSYTDIKQSHKLAEILALESADMCYYIPYEEGDKPLLEQGGFGSTPCWSLSALLGVLPNNEHITTTLSKGGYRISTLEYTNSWFVDYEDENNGLNNCVTSADNPIDACYKMILKLHKQNLL